MTKRCGSTKNLHCFNGSMLLKVSALEKQQKDTKAESRGQKSGDQ